MNRRVRAFNIAVQPLRLLGGEPDRLLFVRLRACIPDARRASEMFEPPSRTRWPMIRRRVLSLAAALLLVAGPAFADRHAAKGPPRHHPMEGVQIGDPALGKQLFRTKGCVTCHAVRGLGGGVGPDLGNLQHTHNIYQMAAVMWNHATQMQQVMDEKRFKRPEFKGDQMAHLLAYLHSLEVLGDVERGRTVFQQKGCARCHAIGGEGGKLGPALAPTSHPHPPIELAGVMWNHSPTMSAMMSALKMSRPVFEGTEMADLLAYLGIVQRQGRAEAPAHRPQKPGH